MEDIVQDLYRSPTHSLCCVQIVQVAAGGMHSVALTAEGEVYTCGVNDEGALGRETSACIHIKPSAS